MFSLGRPALSVGGVAFRPRSCKGLVLRSKPVPWGWPHSGGSGTSQARDRRQTWVQAVGGAGERRYQEHRKPQASSWHEDGVAEMGFLITHFCLIMARGRSCRKGVFDHPLLPHHGTRTELQKWVFDHPRLPHLFLGCKRMTTQTRRVTSTRDKFARTSTG